MKDTGEIFRKSILTAQNHLTRAREGQKLLDEDRPLSEIQTPIIGLEDDELKAKRMEFLSNINGFDKAALTKRLQLIEKQIEVAEHRQEKGTSELYWNRLAILDLLER